MKIKYCEELVLEVGRLCNMECLHCLRGDMQNIAMQFHDAKKIIDQIDYIGNITFSGGEPTLYGDFICEVIDYIINTKKDVGGFYIASNGKIFDSKLMLKLVEFYAYINPYPGEEYVCTFDISNDSYHNFSENKMFGAFSFVKTKGNVPEYALFTEGRAADYGLGRKSVNLEACFSINDDMVEMIYLNALGNVLPDCNYSYETQDYMEPFHINDMALFDIVTKYNKQATKKYGCKKYKGKGLSNNGLH